MNEPNDLIDSTKSTRSTLRSTLAAHGAIVAGMLAVSAWAWRVLPDDVRIPVHWNAYFEVDRYGGKVEGLLVMPLLSAVVGVLLAIVPFMDPRRKNLMRSFGAYHVCWLGSASVLAVAHIAIVGTALGWAIPSEAIVVAVGLLFVAIGNVMGKIRSNHVMGVRTPWTLANDDVWNKTHRVTGWAFVGFGALVLFTIGVLGQASAALVLLGVGAPLVAVFAIGYSYWLWLRLGRTTSHG